MENDLPSNAIVILSCDGLGAFTILNGSMGTLDVVVDVNGYFE